MGVRVQIVRLASLRGVVVLCLGLMSATAASEVAKRTVSGPGLRSAAVEYTLPAPGLVTVTGPGGEAFTRLKLDGGGLSATVGRPELPTLVDDLEIAPRGAVSIRLTAGEREVLKTPHWVYPVQEPVPKRPGALARRRFAFDRAWYGSPRKAVVGAAGLPFTSTTYTVRGRRYVRVSASPYAYDPVSRELSYPATVRLELAVAEPALPAAAGPRTGPVQVLRVPVPSRAALAELQARRVDIKTVREGVAVVHASAAERQALEEAGYALELLAVQDAGGAVTKAITDGYHSWAQVQGLLAQFATDYPTLCRLETIGTSVQGRPILGVRVTDQPDREEAEPEVRFVGAIHGDEVVGTEMCLRFLDLLLDGYATDSRIRALVDETDIWVVPVMNPDGFVAGSRRNATGIDLNRSFPDGAVDTIGTVFSGPAMDTAGRPPETIAMMQWSAARSFVLSATFHTGALVANYPYDNDGLGSVYSPTPDQDVFVWLAETYSSHNAPMWASPEFVHGVTNGADWYVVEGGMQDWLYRYLGCLDLTLEISTSDLPSATALTTLWNDNREAMLAYLETAHTGLYGAVSEAGTGAPVYASIAVEGRSSPVYSDPDLGDYYRLLRPGTYTVTVSAPGYQPQTLNTVAVTADRATRLDVALVRTDVAGSVPLIVVHQASHDASFAAYREQKASEGYAVTEIRLTGAPTAEAVRTQVRAAYASTLAQYVVIMGDVAAVPTFTNSAYDGYSSVLAYSDLAYALLDPGETFDDFLGKDVAIGRISLDSDAELAEYVPKLAAFVAGPRHHDLTWVSGGSTPTEYDICEATHDSVIATSLPPTGINHQRFYRGVGSATELTAHINAGTDMVVYSGHGDVTGWQRYDYRIGTLSSLTNMLDAPIVLGHCCLTGSFQTDTCFAEAWLATPQRAVAYVGGSQDTLWDEDDVLERGEFQWLYEHPGGTLGEALDEGLRQTAAAYPDTAEYYFTIYHVFGDPTVRPFGLPLAISHEPLADTGNRTGPYEVQAAVTSEAAVAAVTLHWRPAGVGAFTAVPLAAVGGTAYRGSIPGQPYGTLVEYYLTAQDSNGVTAVHPAGAPVSLHTFRVGVTLTPVPHGNTADTVGPYRIQAAVNADAELAVTLYWRTAAGASVPVVMVADGAGSYTGEVPGQPDGTTVSYYLAASTAAGYAVYQPADAPASLHSFLIDCQAPLFAGLASASSGDRYVALTWAAAADLSAPVTYHIFRAPAAGSQDFASPLATTQALAFTDEAVSNGTLYYYVVRAVDAVGNRELNLVELEGRPCGPEMVYSWPFDSDPGWTADAGWAYGVPLGGGGEAHGGPDPSAGATGMAVVGYNLGGDYANSMPAGYLTTGVIDCSGISGTQLRFQRWLNVERPDYDQATIDVSCDGTTWQRLWENPAEVTDSAWTQQILDLAAVADGCATLRIRWGMGPTDSSWTYSGWNLDDVQIWGLPVPALTHRLTLAALPPAGGTIAADPAPGPDGHYPEGTVVTLTAAPAPGYDLTGWSGDASGAALAVHVVMAGDRTVTATFGDVTPPTVNGLVDDNTPRRSMTWTWSAAEAGVTFRHAIDTDPDGLPNGAYGSLTTATQADGDGVYYLHVQAVDDAGNESAVVTVHARLDNTAPRAPRVRGLRLVHTSTPGWRWGTGGGGGNGQFRYQLDDTGGAWTETSARSFRPSAALPDGTHTLYVQERDTAGNWSAAGAWATTVDALCTVTYRVEGHGTLAGVPVQVVPYRGSTSAVTARAEDGHAFCGWSDGRTDNPRTDAGLVADLQVAALFAAVSSPVSEVLATVDIDGVAAGRGWWNLTGHYSTVVGEIALELDLVHDARGRLTGSATGVIAGDTDVPLRIRGSVRGNGRSVVATLALQGTSADRGTRLALNLVLAMDAEAGVLVGPATGSVVAADLRDPVVGTVTLPLPTDVAGTWTLRFSLNYAADTVTGTAVLTFSNLVECQFALTGQRVDQTAVLTLAGPLTDPAAGRLRIATTVVPLDGQRALLRAFSGQGYGQRLKW